MAEDFDGAAGAGLTSTEAAARLAREGPNALPSADRVPLARMIAKVVLEPMILMLLGAGGIYLVIGSVGEALFLLVSAGVPMKPPSPK